MSFEYNNFGLGANPAGSITLDKLRNEVAGGLRQQIEVCRQFKASVDGARRYGQDNPACVMTPIEPWFHTVDGQLVLGVYCRGQVVNVDPTLNAVQPVDFDKAAEVYSALLYQVLAGELDEAITQAYLMSL